MSSHRPSRRDLLASFLGLPAALAACRRKRRGDYGGAIVGGAVSVGHRLRTDAGALREACARTPAERIAVLIVGAGPSGLSAAWRFSRAGFNDFVVLDLEDAPGGTSRWGENHVSAYPWGAHYVPVPMPNNRALIALLREMGIVEGITDTGEVRVGEEFLVRDLDERVFYRGRWHEGLYLREGASREDLRQLRAFQAEVDRWVAFRDARGRRAFALPMSIASDDAEVTALDRMTMGEWMRARGFTSPRLQWLVDYACRDDYGLRAEYTSAWAGLFYFASRQPRPGAPAQELIAWPEGNGRLVRHLARVAGPRVRLSHLVTDITPTGQSVRVHALDVRAGAPRAFEAEQIVVALPKFVARHVVGPWRERPPTQIEAFTYSPWMVANVTLRDRPRAEGIPMAWDNVLYESPSLGYVCATHQSLRDYGPTVLTYYYPMTGVDVRAERARLLAASWREWADVVISDLSRAHPDIEPLVERVDIYRWGHGMVRPLPGLLWGPARAAAAEPLEGRVFFAHSDLSGLALFEEAHDRGVAAAEAVLRARGIAFESMR